MVKILAQSDWVTHVPRNYRVSALLEHKILNAAHAETLATLMAGSLLLKTDIRCLSNLFVEMKEQQILSFGPAAVTALPTRTLEALQAVALLGAVAKVMHESDPRQKLIDIFHECGEKLSFADFEKLTKSRPDFTRP